MSVVNIKIEGDEAVKFNELLDRLEFNYPKEFGPMPPGEYCTSLVYALWKNDPVLLMKVLDTQDVNPWNVSLVDHGTSSNSPDLQSLVEFAAREESWKCVAVLIHHYCDCSQGVALTNEMSPAMMEYETATVPERIAHLEFKMRAFLKGIALFRSARLSMDFVNMPAHVNSCPKSSRFLFKEFSSHKFQDKKTLGPIENKRLELRQKALSAISVGDVKTLMATLDIMKVNAAAYRAAKRVGYDSLTMSEINNFITAALSCNYPECVIKIISKAVEFKKAESWASAARKRIGEEYLMKVLAHEDAKELFEMISNMTKDIDQHQCVANATPVSEIQAAIGNAMSSILIEVDDLNYIKDVKKRSEDSLTVMKDCVNQACARAASRIEKGEIENSLPTNTETVGMPRERVRL